MKSDYRAAAAALRRLGIGLAAVGDRRWSDPPKLMSVDPRPSNRAEVPAPTFDTVVDERRWALSQAMSEAEVWLRRVAVEAGVHADAVAAALGAWNNDPRDEDER